MRSSSAGRLALGAALLAALQMQAAIGGVWTPTATGTLPMPAGALLGPAPPDTPMRIMVALKLRNPGELDDFIAAIATPGSPAFGARLTPAQFTERYLPTPQQAQDVAGYLARQGFANVTTSSNRMLVQADGTAATVGAAFRTRIDRFVLNGQTVHANAMPAQVPDSLAVNAVLGLQDAAVVRAPARAAAAKDSAAAPPRLRILIPPFFQVAYDAMSTPTAAATVAAIVMTVDPGNVLDDLRQVEAMNNMPQVPVQIRRVSNPGPVGGSDSEFDLDSQAANGVAGEFRELIFYADPGTVGHFTLPVAAVNQWASDDLAPAASMSLSNCEEITQADGTTAAMESALKQAVAQGQTLFVDSGDFGAACTPGTVLPTGNAGVRSVNYPASSAYAVGVGGTELSTIADFGYGGELGWGGSGGGFSLLVPAPAWQSGVAPSAAGGRSVPDISMASVPGMLVISDGNLSFDGNGTSLAAPLAMGAWARVLSAAGNQPGFAAPYFYALYSAAANAGDLAAARTGFRDVVGDDALPRTALDYHAAPGYDHVTGIGSIDICALANLLAPGHADYCAAPPAPAAGVGGTVRDSATTAAVCTAPGMPIADSTSGTPISLHLAEPAGDPDRIIFTIGVSLATPLPSNSAWAVQFATADGQLRFVQMDTFDGGPAPGFHYGVVTDNLGTYQAQGELDAASTYSTAAGTVTLVARKAWLGAPPPATNLSYLSAHAPASRNVGGVEFNPAATADRFYTLRAADLCAGEAAGGGRGGALPWPLLLPIAAIALLRRRWVRRL